MYQEIKPSTSLHHLIDSFWTFSDPHDCGEFKVMPDGCTDLIFDLNQDEGYLSGVMTRFQLKKLSQAPELIGIRFKLENFSALSHIPLLETKNLKVGLADVIPTHLLEKLKHLNDFKATSDKIKLLERFVTDLSKNDHQPKDQLVYAVTKLIRLRNGNINVREVAQAHHTSLRQLQRRFKDYTGLTIKEFSGIVRFGKAKKAIASSSETSLLAIALDTGFYDHSHMAYEFNRLSGENPGFFR